jgi:hypothetical protein
VTVKCIQITHPIKKISYPPFGLAKCKAGTSLEEDKMQLKHLKLQRTESDAEWHNLK